MLQDAVSDWAFYSCSFDTEHLQTVRGYNNKNSDVASEHTTTYTQQGDQHITHLLRMGGFSCGSNWRHPEQSGPDLRDIGLHRSLYRRPGCQPIDGQYSVYCGDTRRKLCSPLRWPLGRQTGSSNSSWSRVFPIRAGVSLTSFWGP